VLIDEFFITGQDLQHLGLDDARSVRVQSNIAQDNADDFVVHRDGMNHGTVTLTDVSRAGDSSLR